MSEKTSSTLTGLPSTTGQHAGLDEAQTRSRNMRVLWLLIVSAFVVILNETTMAVALRPIMLDLGVDERAGQWLTTAFLLTMAIVIPITGFLLQRFHTKPLYIAAMTFFSIGTLIAALAPGFEILLLARVVQASGTAIMMPLLMTTIMTLVPPHERGKMMGSVSIVISVAPAIGPTVSGLLLSTVGWRGIFWTMLPIALAMLIYGIRRVQNVSEPRKLPLDGFSVLLSAIGFGGLIYGLSQIGAPQTEGVGSVVMWIALGAGVLALTVFVLRQLVLQRADNALLDLRTFAATQFTISLALMLVMMASLFGTLIVLPLYLLGSLGMEPVAVGLLLLPGGLLMGLLAPFVGRIFDRLGPTPLLIPGTIIVSAALWSFTLITATTSPLQILASHVTLSLGLALIFTPLFTTSLGAVTPHLYSHASAMLGTLQQIAGASGTALFITIMASRSAALSAGGASDAVANAGGAQAAFTAGAILSLFAIVGAFFVRKPADMENGPHSAH